MSRENPRAKFRNDEEAMDQVLRGMHMHKIILYHTVITVHNHTVCIHGMQWCMCSMTLCIQYLKIYYALYIWKHIRKMAFGNESLVAGLKLRLLYAYAWIALYGKTEMSGMTSCSIILYLPVSCSSVSYIYLFVITIQYTVYASMNTMI